MTLPRALIAACVAVGLAAASADAARLRGVVLDRAGQPVELADVRVVGQHQGTVTGADGRFELVLTPGPVTLVLTLIGYQRVTRALTIADSIAELRVTLADAPVPVAEVNVQASSFGQAGRSQGAVLSRRDVVTTPGGTADVFQSLRTLPGINAPDEGAAVYIRGGDPDETLIRLDGGVIGHPYHYESASGGLFSTIDSYMLKSAFFSSGGFSARYGGVLSGVLDIETQDPLDLRTVSLGANLAGWNTSSSWSLVPGRLAAIASIDQGFPAVLFKLYGTDRDYEEAPTSGNAFVKLLGRYSPTGRAALSYLESGDALTLDVEQLNVRERYHDDAHNRLVSGQFSDLLGGRVAVRGQASTQFYETRWDYGVFGGVRTERNAQANLDATWDMGTRHQVRFGADLRHEDTAIVGRFPADSTNLGPDAPVETRASRPKLEYPGVYLEDEMRLVGPVYASLGVRADHLSVPAVWTTDPRVSLAWRIDPHQTVRLATGRYHQPADPADLDPIYGNPRLGPLTSEHLIAGYEWKSEYGNVRVEGYHKRYRGLITDDPTRYYVNGGTGYARGVDVFVHGTWHWLSGWVSYGYLDTRRKQADDPIEVPSPYGVRHSMTLVSMYQLSPALQLGVRYSAASGRPYTPVIGRTYDPTLDLWRPVYGDHGSGSLPAYHRVDVRATRLFSLPAYGALKPSSVCAAYVEGLNVLGIRNVLEYVYDSDYSTREARSSYFSRRMLVAGLSVSW